MIVIHGVGYYGKVDQVKGLFHVVTLFPHLYWIPIFPRKSYLILKGGEENSGVTIPIKLSGKSILFTYLRLFAFFVALLSLPVIIGLVADGLDHGWRRAHIGPWIFFTSVFIAILVSLALSYRWGRASPERALELAALAGIDPATLASYFVERMTSDEEDRLRNLAAEQVHSTQNSP